MEATSSSSEQPGLDSSYNNGQGDLAYSPGAENITVNMMNYEQVYGNDLTDLYRRKFRHGRQEQDVTPSDSGYHLRKKPARLLRHGAEPEEPRRGRRKREVVKRSAAKSGRALRKRACQKKGKQETAKQKSRARFSLMQNFKIVSKIRKKAPPLPTMFVKSKPGKKKNVKIAQWKKTPTEVVPVPPTNQARLMPKHRHVFQRIHEDVELKDFDENKAKVKPNMGHVPKYYEPDTPTPEVKLRVIDYIAQKKREKDDKILRAQKNLERMNMLMKKRSEEERERDQARHSLKQIRSGLMSKRNELFADLKSALNKEQEVKQAIEEEKKKLELIELFRRPKASSSDSDQQQQNTSTLITHQGASNLGMPTDEQVLQLKQLYAEVIREKMLCVLKDEIDTSLRDLVVTQEIDNALKQKNEKEIRVTHDSVRQLLEPMSSGCVDVAKLVDRMMEEFYNPRASVDMVAMESKLEVLRMAIQASSLEDSGEGSSSLDVDNSAFYYSQLPKDSIKMVKFLPREYQFELARLMEKDLMMQANEVKEELIQHEKERNRVIKEAAKEAAEKEAAEKEAVATALLRSEAMKSQHSYQFGLNNQLDERQRMQQKISGHQPFRQNSPMFPQRTQQQFQQVHQPKAQKAVPQKPVPQNPLCHSPLPQKPMPQNPLQQSPLAQHPIAQSPIPQNVLPQNVLPQNTLPQINMQQLQQLQSQLQLATQSMQPQQQAQSHHLQNLQMQQNALRFQLLQAAQAAQAAQFQSQLPSFAHPAHVSMAQSQLLPQQGASMLFGASNPLFMKPNEGTSSNTTNEPK